MNQIGRFEGERMCESIVVDEGQNTIGSDFFSKLKNTLVIHQCFDIKIVNMMDTKKDLEKYKKLAE